MRPIMLYWDIGIYIYIVTELGTTIELERIFSSSMGTLYIAYPIPHYNIYDI